MDHPGFPGQKVYIARLIKELMQSGAHERLKTIERTGARGGRVGNALQHNLPQPPATDHEKDDADGEDIEQDPGELEVADGLLLRLDDTVGALVTIRGSPTLIVCEVSQLVSASGHPVQPSHGLPISELEDIRATVMLRPLRSDFNEGPPATLSFTGDSEVAEQRVQAPFIQPIQLEASPAGFSMEPSVLSGLSSHIWLRVTASSDVFEHIQTVPVAAMHTDSAGDPLFVLGGYEVRQGVREQRSSGRVCGIGGCESKFRGPPSEKICHASYHAICTPQAMVHAEMCPLCYGPASECPVFLVKVAKTPQPFVICKATEPSANRSNPESGVKLQMGRISKSSLESPSSNHPIVCPECHPQLAIETHKADGAPKTQAKKPKNRPAVWKYNMLIHWAREHKNTPMPRGLEASLLLEEGERSLLQRNRGFAVKERK